MTSAYTWVAKLLAVHSVTSQCSRSESLHLQEGENKTQAGSGVLPVDSAEGHQGEWGFVSFPEHVVEDGSELPRHSANVLTGETWATPAFTLGVENPVLERARLWARQLQVQSHLRSLGFCFYSHGELTVPGFSGGLVHPGRDNKLFEVKISQSISDSCPSCGEISGSAEVKWLSAASDSTRFFPRAAGLLKSAILLCSHEAGRVP